MLLFLHVARRFFFFGRLIFARFRFLDHLAVIRAGPPTCKKKVFQVQNQPKASTQQTQQPQDSGIWNPQGSPDPVTIFLVLLKPWTFSLAFSYEFLMPSPPPSNPNGLTSCIFPLAGELAKCHVCTRTIRTQKSGRGSRFQNTGPVSILFSLKLNDVF